MQGETLSGPFFGVFNSKGWCIAVGRCSDQALEAARERLNASILQEVRNRCRVVAIDRDAAKRCPPAFVPRAI